MRPVHDMLVKNAGRLSAHMPGHKGHAPFGAEDLVALDTTELPVTDDLYSPERALLTAQRLYAAQAGAAETIFLHNGSTSGIHVMVQLYAGEGDTVLMGRNAHLSAVNGCIAGGVKAAWIPVTQRTDGYCYIAEQSVLEAIDAHPEARALLLTRPDYYGGCIPLARLIARAHERGMRVVIDEAHGAHFPWMEGTWSAMALGADACTQSVHKTLPGLTGTAVLHLRDGGDRERALRLLRREQTSSPSFLLMMSIDDSRAWMAQEGGERLKRTIGAANEARLTLEKAGYADAHRAWADTGYTFDPTRLVICAPQGGEQLSEALQERGVDVEMHDLSRVVMILTAMDGEEEIAALAGTAASVRADTAKQEKLPDVTHIPHQAMQVRQAAMAMSEAVPLDEAEGRVAAQPAGLYPPGIPLAAPGEVLGAEVIRLLREAGSQRRFGVEGETILCVKQ